MTSPLERAKEARLAEAASCAGAEAGPFVATVYEHVPPADIAPRSAADLAGAALALWHFAAHRKPGRPEIRVYNPDRAHDGWSSPDTIVEIVNDDMPFLVDSVTAAITGGDRVVHLVIHPVLSVARDSAGARFAIDSGAVPSARESWMQIAIGREHDESARARLAGTLAGVLSDVRAVVADWPAMQQRLKSLLDELARRPPPLPAPEIAEIADFLRWLDDDNFTFLGFRDYAFTEADVAPLAPLGILGDDAYPVFEGLRELTRLPAAVADFVRRRELLVVTKTNRRATVHRPTHMDAIGLRRFDADGAVVGMRVFVGLFTTLAYSRSPRAIPLLRRKVAHTLARAGLAPASHDGKALLHILESFPRDELFQIGEDALFDTVTGILNLQERQRIALFVRADPLERFVSCLVYVPRERYDARLRDAFSGILAQSFDGETASVNTHLDEDLLARLQFIVRTRRGHVPPVDPAALEERLALAGQSWTDRVAAAATAAFGEDEGRARLRALGPFPPAYQARTIAAQAVADLAPIAAVLAGAPLAVALYRQREDCADDGGEGAPIGLRLYRAIEPVALSDVLPILENLGLRVVAEEPFRVAGSAGGVAWVHALTLAPGSLATGGEAVPASLAARFAEALVAVWTGEIENDGFNRLVLAAGLGARQTVVLRLYCKFLRQAGSAFSQAYMEDTLWRHAAIARRLVHLFELRFDPDAGPGLAAIAELQAIDHALDAVASLDEDRILRAFLTLILKSVRTNYYQRLPTGGPKPYLAVKLSSREIELLPKPRPLYEIFVYSPRVEGIHLRAGRVARGGIRWSDRKEDFRSEILQLMRAQTVKNAVIVPVGSKGGFVLKRAPEGATALHEEGVACYEILMRGLLDLTDNIVVTAPRPGESERRVIVPPQAVLRHDGDDPYLVVAADKGTASFSDIANRIAGEYGFWLGDAFASGGSAGYDHKAMGITSRGAWELVKRHFRELGRDIDTSPLTVIGVGDMSGDVFGNGMQRSRHIRLLAAFNHRDLFIDPDPDPERSFAERQRLFELPASSWRDYDKSAISAGGGVFDRALKSIPLSPEMKGRFAIAADHPTPAELIRALLAEPVDLLWFGGIGTFVKAAAESHAEAGDRTNDALRIDAEGVRALVVGEGANLAVTPRGRVAYAMAGGRIDSDAIDNSAGVDTSDHEVNIKVLVDGAIAHGALPAAERGTLLASLEDEIAALVLRDNYLQGEALSLAEAAGTGALDRQIRVLHALEHGHGLDRALEALPDDKALAARAAGGRGLVRPELAALLAFAKMALYDELLASDLPDLPALRGDLAHYFPQVLGSRLAAQLATHPLCREIVATVVTNDLVNRAGLTFVEDMRARTGAGAATIARAYRVVRAVFELPSLWAAIEALDNRVAAALQIDMLGEIASLVEHAAAVLLRSARPDLDLESTIARFTPGTRTLAEALGTVLPPADREIVARRTRRLAEAGVPEDLAQRIAGLKFLAASFDIAALGPPANPGAEAAEPERAAAIYFAVGTRFALDEMREAARRLPAETPWQKLAVETTLDDLYAVQADLAARVLADRAAGADDPVARWAEGRAAALALAEALALALRAAASPDLAMLVVAIRQLRQAVG